MLDSGLQVQPFAFHGLLASSSKSKVIGPQKCQSTSKHLLCLHAISQWLFVPIAIDYLSNTKWWQFKWVIFELQWSR